VRGALMEETPQENIARDDRFLVRMIAATDR
jgi:hypothetical protein